MPGVLRRKRRRAWSGRSLVATGDRSDRSLGNSLVETEEREGGGGVGGRELGPLVPPPKPQNSIEARNKRLL
jgi:hypothetical protein